MKSALASASIVLLSATSSLAHSSAHMHPHGSESWIAGALFFGTCVLAASARVVQVIKAERRK